MWVETRMWPAAIGRLFLALAQIEQDRKPLLLIDPLVTKNVAVAGDTFNAAAIQSCIGVAQADERAIQAQHGVTLTGERGHVDRRMIGAQAKPRRPSVNPASLELSHCMGVRSGSRPMPLPGSFFSAGSCTSPAGIGTSVMPISSP